MTLQYTYDGKGNPVGVFIPINDWENIKTKYAELDQLSDNADTKDQILNSIRKGFDEIKLHEKGKLKLKNLKEALDDL